MRWEQGVVKALSGKVKDRSNALQEINNWIKNPHTQDDVEPLGLQRLMEGISVEIKKDLDANIDKILQEVKASIVSLSALLQTFKDLLAASVDKLQVSLLNYLLATLEDYADVKIVSKCFSKCLAICLHCRVFREHIEPVQYSRIHDFCVKFFLATDPAKQSTPMDRRSECVDLASSYCILVSGSYDANVARQLEAPDHAGKILVFISKYISLYSVENQAFELFLETALRVLLILDVNDLEVSFSFLRRMIFRLLEFLRSKNEGIRYWSLNLLRAYVSIGSQRDESDEERSGVQSFLSTCSRIQRDVFAMLESNTASYCHSLDHFGLSVEIKPGKETVSDSECFSLAILQLAADLCWLSLQQKSSESAQTAVDLPSGSVTPSSEDGQGPRKKSKMDSDRTRLASLLASSRPQHNITALQIIALVAQRHSNYAEDMHHLYSSYLCHFARSHDRLTALNAFCTMSLLVAHGGVAAKSTADRLWDDAFQMALVLAEEGTPAPAPFLLLTALVRKRLISTKKIMALMEFFYEVDPKYLVDDSLKCLGALFEFGNLWDRDCVAKITERILLAVEQNGKGRNYATSESLIELLCFVVESPAVPAASPKWFEESSIPPLLPGRLLFEHFFRAMETRLAKSSGFRGNELGRELVDAHSTAEAPPPNSAKGVRVKILQSQLIAFLSRHHSSPNRDAHLDLYVLVFVLKLLQTIGPNAPADSDRDALETCLLAFSSAIFDSVASIRGTTRAIVTRFARFESPDHFLWPLPEQLTHFLFESISRVTKSSRKKIDLAGRSSDFHQAKIEHNRVEHLSIFELSYFGESVLSRDYWDLHTRLATAISLLKGRPSDHPDHASFRKELVDAVFPLQPSVFALSVFASVASLLGPILSTDLFLCVSDRMGSYLADYGMERCELLVNVCICFMNIAVPKLEADLVESIEKRSTVEHSVVGKLVAYIATGGAEAYPASTRVDLAKLVCALGTNQALHRLLPDALAHCWRLLALNSFQLRAYYSFCVIPSVVKAHCAVPLATLSELVPTTGMTDVQSIGAALIYGSFFLQVPAAREACFSCLCRIAADQPSLDTVEALMQEISLAKGFPAPVDLAERFLRSGLALWGSTNFDEFPYFLYGLQSIDEFYQKYGDWVIVNLLVEQQHSKIDAVVAACGGTSRFFSRAILALVFGGTDDIEKLKLKHLGTTAYILLSDLDGLDHASRSISHLRHRLDEIGCACPESTEGNAQSSIAALERLFSREIHELEEAPLSGVVWLDVVAKMRLLLFRQGFAHDLKRIFLNGFQLLVICLGKRLVEPIIFQTVLLTLCQYLPNSELCDTVLHLLKYCVRCAGDVAADSLIADQAMRLLSALDACLTLEFAKQSSGLQTLIVSCIDMILASVARFSDEAGDKGKALLIAAECIDASLPVYEPLVAKYNVKTNDLYGLFCWLEKYQSQQGHTKKPFAKLARVLDHVHGKKEKSLIGDIARILSAIVNETAATRKLDPQELQLIAALAKTRIYTLRKFHCQLDAEMIALGFAYDEIHYDGYVYILKALFPYLGDPDLETASLCMKAFAGVLSQDVGTIAAAKLDHQTSGYLKLWCQTQIANSVKRTPMKLVLGWQDSSESDWLSSVVLGLFSEFPFPPFFGHLAPMCSKSSAFAARILPVVFHFKVAQEATAGNHGEEASLSKRIAEFFAAETAHASKVPFRHLLNVVKFLLKVDINRELFGGWHGFDFSVLSEAALFVDDPEFSVYLIEFACSYGMDYSVSKSWNCLLQSYSILNNSDGFHGITSAMGADITDMYSLLERKNRHENKWLQLWSMEDSLLQAGLRNDRSDLISQSLAASGHYFTLDKMLDKDAAGGREQYESMWRLGQWKLHDAFEDYSEAAPINADRCLYNSLERFCRSSSLASLDPMVDDQLFWLGKSPIYDILPLLEIKEAIGIRSGRIEAKPTFDIWERRIQDMIEVHSFGDVERLLAARTVLYSCLSAIPALPWDVSASYKNHLWQMAQLSLENHRLMTARTAALKFKALNGSSGPALERADRMLQKIEWTHGEQSVAMKYYRWKLDKMEGSRAGNTLAYAEMLHDYGMWSVASRITTPRKVIEEFLKPALSIIGDQASERKYGTYYYDLAKYADNIFIDMKNDEVTKRSEELLRQREQDLRHLETQVPPPKNKEYFTKKLRKQIELDRGAVSASQTDRLSFLKLAIDSYLKTLAHSDEKSDHSVFRLISLWFSHHANKDINRAVHEALPSIKPSVFLVLAYQLTARLSSLERDASSPFFATLSRLVETIVLAYPYHTIGYLVALKNVSKEKSKSGISNNASTFLKSLIKNPDVKPIVLGMDQLFTAYISAANQEIPPSKTKDGKYLLDQGSVLLGIAPKHELPVLTCDMPVGKPGDFSQIVHIVKVDKYFSLPGGINAPKVLKCLGSDGVIYKQLVKAKDDLRQDAVLASVFRMINKLLRRKIETRMKQLSIRTYNIVPLASQAGIVQWVDGTAPLGEVLHDAHMQWNKGDWPLPRCRQKMKEEHDRSNSTAKSKLKLFQDILGHVRPVFSKLFFSSYRDPIAWYQNRSRYMKSVAASSMGGYMLGVGDRHSQNLLLDTATGEIIHIDLGIAFDQGKLLSTPEMVPFRLTQNLVDAMGVAKFEGEFKRGCEATLQVLRDEKDILFTLLDVFRHDPLYTWAISPLKLRKVQLDREVEVDVTTTLLLQESQGNVEADMALFGVNKKLSATLSVECQVQELLTNATDPERLATMFHGWQAWL
ncbi:hypothetical protein HDU91_003440 [Kappamyces sp. JEL0680]|nr:hypothetical protein HDU91_003440 [Kappamyces sp. JEL0680]